MVTLTNWETRNSLPFVESKVSLPCSLDAVYTFTPCIFKTSVNNILAPTPSSSNLYLFLGFPTELLFEIFILEWYSFLYHSVWFHRLSNISEECIQAFQVLHPPVPSSLLGPSLLNMFLNILPLYFAPAIVDTSRGRNNDETQVMGWMKTGSFYFIFLWVVCV
jgi:hypothetical protein